MSVHPFIVPFSPRRGHSSLVDASASPDSHHSRRTVHGERFLRTPATPTQDRASVQSVGCSSPVAGEPVRAFSRQGLIGGLRLLIRWALLSGVLALVAWLVPSVDIHG